MNSELLNELAIKLKGFDKVAEKSEDCLCEECKCSPCECDAKDDAVKEASKQVNAMDILKGLSKLAEELDQIGSDDASSAVDDAIKVIVRDLEKQ